MYKVLTNDALQRMAPSVLTKDNSSKVSDKYIHYSTMPVITKLRNCGWAPVEAKETNVRKTDNKGFQKHLIRFIREDLDVGDEEFLSLVLINSHDGKCSYKIMAGIFRVVCTNGLIVGWRQYIARLVHRSYSIEEIEKISLRVATSSTEIAKSIKEMKAIPMSKEEKIIFATDAAKLLNKGLTGKRDVPVESLLNFHRDEDKEDTLWNVYNRVQENGMRGFSYLDNDTKKSRRSRKINSIGREIFFNQELGKLVGNYLN